MLAPEILLEIAIALGTGVGVYAAIRADLARLNERTSHAVKTADHAHVRIDEILRN